MRFISKKIIAVITLSLCAIVTLAQAKQLNGKNDPLSIVAPIKQESGQFAEKLWEELETGWDGLCSAISKHLSERENLKQAKISANHFAVILKDFEKKADEHNAKMRAKIYDALSQNEKSRKEFLTGYDKGVQLSKNVLKEFIEGKQEVLNIINQMLSFFYLTMEDIKIENGLYAFENEEDEEQYHQILKKLDEKEEALLEIEKKFDSLPT